MNTKQVNTALLVVDVQQGLFQKSTPIYEAERLLDNITALIARAQRVGAPVIYIQHSSDKFLIKGSDEWQLHPRLQPENRDYRVHKLEGNAFEGTNLGEVLQSSNITHLVITGLVTHGCVKSTCIGALELGYKVTLVKDAHSNYCAQAADLIEKWNTQLAAKGALLKAAAEVDFTE